MIQNPLIGMTGLDPQDADSTHALQNSLGATYAVCGINWDQYKNGVGTGSGMDHFDRMFWLNRPYKQILRFSGVPLDQIRTFSAAIVNRYKPWAIVPCMEQTDVALISETSKAFSDACPDTLMIVGNGYSSYDPAFMDALASKGVLAMGHIIGAHDYNACEQPYYCPDEKLPPWAGTPNMRPALIDRIKILQSYAHLTRQSGQFPKAMLVEYGLNFLRPRDAYVAGLIARLTNCPICLSTPQGPANRTDSAIYNNGIYDENGNGTWSESVRRFSESITQ